MNERLQEAIDEACVLHDGGEAEGSEDEPVGEPAGLLGKAGLGRHLIFTVGCYQTTCALYRSLDLEADADIPDLLRAQAAQRDGSA